jgi:hypothetical protein
MPSAARRWPSLNGQPSKAFVVGPVDCQWIWTACRVATPLIAGRRLAHAFIGGPVSNGSSAAWRVTAVRGWCPVLDRPEQVGQIEARSRQGAELSG